MPRGSWSTAAPPGCWPGAGDDDGAFLGELGDPMAIEAGPDGSLAVVGSDAGRV
jgi:hypothetical protein